MAVSVELSALEPSETTASLGPSDDETETEVRVGLSSGTSVSAEEHSGSDGFGDEFNDAPLDGGGSTCAGVGREHASATKQTANEKQAVLNGMLPRTKKARGSSMVPMFAPGGTWTRLAARRMPPS